MCRGSAGGSHKTCTKTCVSGASGSLRRSFGFCPANNLPHTGPVSDLGLDARASWRRFWRNGPLTPRQVADQAIARLATAEELTDTPADLRNLADPYDSYLAEHATDPLTVHHDKARRVHAGQTIRRLRRRVTAAKHRRSH